MAGTEKLDCHPPHYENESSLMQVALGDRNRTKKLCATSLEKAKIAGVIKGAAEIGILEIDPLQELVAVRGQPAGDAVRVRHPGRR
jgi:hypothetical protein